MIELDGGEEGILGTFSTRFKYLIYRGLILNRDESVHIVWNGNWNDP